MCFTIEVHLTRKVIEDRFKINTSILYDFDFAYFYHAYTNPYLPVVTQDEPNRVSLMQWGLIPSWVRDLPLAEKIRKGTYNARSESLHEKPSFRSPFTSGRCWILGHGFFEWQHLSGTTIPWYIKLKQETPFVFAGIYDTWRDPGSGKSYQTFSLITTKANPLMEHIHNTKKRMPVILSPEAEKEWIAPETTVSRARELLIPFPEENMQAYQVSKAINHPDTDPGDPSVIKPVEPPVPGSLF